MGSGYLSPAGPRAIAHRGLATEAPENTLLAFLAALAAGATHLETDVHASRDGVAIVSHDPDLRRLTGRPGTVAELTAAELRRLDLGQGQGFCTLAELLDGFPTARVNIDVKSADAVEPTILAIRSMRATDRVLVTSFSGARRLPVVRALPGVATSVSAAGVLGAVVAGRSGLRPALRRVLRDVDAIQLPERVLGLTTTLPRVVRAFQSAGVEVHVWTVNDPRDMDRLLDAGVDGLVTDRVDLALGVIAARAGDPNPL